MVDNTLKDLLRGLSAADKVELRALIDEDLADLDSPHLEARLNERWATIRANPEDFVSIDEDERELRARRSAA
ncbi:MAG: hypothetical protein QM607_06100 [Microbacterium sp.]